MFLVQQRLIEISHKAEESITPHHIIIKKYTFFERVMEIPKWQIETMTT